MKIELLWFQDCSNHHAAEAMLNEVLSEFGVKEVIERVEVPDAEVGKRLTFPGSPTIRINGLDVEPGWQACDDCTPRCWLYLTSEGLRGLPEKSWIRQGIETALSSYRAIEEIGSRPGYLAFRVGRGRRYREVHSLD